MTTALRPHRGLRRCLLAGAVVLLAVAAMYLLFAVAPVLMNAAGDIPPGTDWKGDAIFDAAAAALIGGLAALQFVARRRLGECVAPPAGGPPPPGGEGE